MLKHTSRGFVFNEYKNSTKQKLTVKKNYDDGDGVVQWCRYDSLSQKVDRAIAPSVSCEKMFSSFYFLFSLFSFKLTKYQWFVHLLSLSQLLVTFFLIGQFGLVSFLFHARWVWGVAQDARCSILQMMLKLLWCAESSCGINIANFNMKNFILKEIIK